MFANAGVYRLNNRARHQDDDYRRFNQDPSAQCQAGVSAQSIHLQ
jgi:hypothetical protein